ncbi:MAG: hypothetical protein KBG21_06235 [Ignavibacteria bacterium]|nr:hypothetical protein [Ignavibacteria bacterium]
MLEKIGIILELLNNEWKTNSFKKNEKNYIKAFTALHVIEITQLGIDYYDTIELKDISDEKFYFYTYGIFQSFFGQTEAAKSLLSSILNISNIKTQFRVMYPELQSIVDKRNNAVGHPTDRTLNGKISFHEIYPPEFSGKQITLYNKFSLLENEHTEINIVELVYLQKKHINLILDEIIVKLKSEIMKHNKKFHNIKLLNLLPPTTNYLISNLLIENCNNGKYKASFETLHKIYIEIKKEMNDRYDESHSWETLFSTLDFIFEKLGKEISGMEKRVYAIALKTSIGQLKELLKSVDMDFSKKI